MEAEIYIADNTLTVDLNLSGQVARFVIPANKISFNDLEALVYRETKIHEGDQFTTKEVTI